MEIRKVLLTASTYVQCLLFHDAFSTDSYHNVSLTWNEDGKMLRLTCRILRMGLGVIFIDPKGHSRGHCNSPILSRNVTGTCDYGMMQTILPDQNVDNVLIIQLVKCENGVWKCIHGHNRNEEDAKQVVMDINIICPEMVNTFWERCRCAIPPLVIGYILGYFICKLIVHTIKACCRKNEDQRGCCNIFWNEVCLDEFSCWQYLLKKLISIVTCVLIVPFLALIEVLCQDGMTYTLLIGIWSFAIVCLEVLLSKKIFSFIERKCPEHCVCKAVDNEQNKAQDRISHAHNMTDTRQDGAQGPLVLGNRVVHNFPGGRMFFVGLFSDGEVQCKW